MESREAVTVLGCPRLLDNLNIVLASQSPRRFEILKERMKFKSVVCIPSTFPEDLDKQNYKNPKDYAMETARLKGQEVAKRVWKDMNEVDVVISADTIVQLGGRILEKPIDSDDAKKMLLDIATSKEPHSVITGVAIHIKSLGYDKPASVFSTTSEVHFGDIGLIDIENYVMVGESLDKSGSYGIESLGSMLIKSINGCFYNIQGLPLYDLSVELAKLYNKGLLIK